LAAQAVKISRAGGVAQMAKFAPLRSGALGELESSTWGATQTDSLRYRSIETACSLDKGRRAGQASAGLATISVEVYVKKAGKPERSEKQKDMIVAIQYQEEMELQR